VKPRLGQHFLVDRNIAKFEIEQATISSSDVVLEIGPGKGVLTALLAQYAKQVLAIELDSGLIDELKKWVPSNVTLIHADAAKVDLDMLPSFTKVVANLPYQISSPFTFRLLNASFHKAVLIYQLEFAERMIAQPNTSMYSRLSVGVQYRMHCRILKKLSSNCFNPPPLVDSAIVELIPRSIPICDVVDEAFFYDMVRVLFSYRRKKIGTIVRMHWNIASDVPFAENRVESLSIKQIASISDYIYMVLQKNKT